MSAELYSYFLKKHSEFWSVFFLTFVSTSPTMLHTVRKLAKTI